MDTKKSATEIPSLFQLFKLGEKALPKVFTYVGEDSFEFEIAVDFFKEKLDKQGENLDIIVIVAEGGEQQDYLRNFLHQICFFRENLSF
jgi:hypothetical protein